MTRQEREELWSNHLSWDIKTQQLYDETYNKVYRQEMNRYNEQKPRHWYEADALALATNMAEDAVNEHLTKNPNEVI